MKTTVISAFPACGKSYFFNNYKEKLTFNGVLDSDSSNFSWVKDSEGNNTKERNPEFPQNYIKHIKENIGKVEVIFVSSHDIVRKALEEAKIEYTLIYPDKLQKEEWERRFKERGNDEGFINFISNNWEKFLDEIEEETFPDKIKLPWNGRRYIDFDLVSSTLKYSDMLHESNDMDKEVITKKIPSLLNEILKHSKEDI